MEAEVRAVLKEFRSGDKEAAFFELLEMPGDLLPIMIDIFRSERLPEVRAFLVKVAWERRDVAALPFLGEALNAPEEKSGKKLSMALWRFLRKSRWKFCNPPVHANSETSPPLIVFASG
jgi:hypothetical protein